MKNTSTKDWSSGMATAEFLQQGDFHQRLHVEKKRAQRSGTAFVLVLIESIEPGTSTPQSGQRLLNDLNGCLRATDIRGWYADHATAGVIFTDLEPNGAASLAPILVSDLRKRLATAMGAGDLTGLRLSFTIYSGLERDVEPRSPGREQESLCENPVVMHP